MEPTDHSPRGREGSLAQAVLFYGSAQAAANQSQPAQSSASAAEQALAEAQAALAMAQAGMNSQMAQGKGQGQGQGQGQGKGQGQGQGQGNPSPEGDGRQGNWAGNGGADGPRRNVGGSSSFTGLPQRDRAAILQSQGEKYPQEYGPLVEQYLKNLSDQSK